MATFSTPHFIVKLASVELASSQRIRASCFNKPIEQIVADIDLLL